MNICAGFYGNQLGTLSGFEPFARSNSPIAPGCVKPCQNPYIYSGFYHFPNRWPLRQVATRFNPERLKSVRVFVYGPEPEEIPRLRHTSPTVTIIFTIAMKK
jgi:hypothetical protein